MPCEKDQYLLAVYALTGSISLLTSGIFLLFAIADQKPKDDARMKMKIEQYNEENPPTSTSEESLDQDPNLQWYQTHLRL